MAVQPNALNPMVLLQQAVAAQPVSPLMMAQAAMPYMQQHPGYPQHLNNIPQPNFPPTQNKIQIQIKIPASQNGKRVMVIPPNSNSQIP
jgi:hypothetical protein